MNLRLGQDMLNTIAHSLILIFVLASTANAEEKYVKNIKNVGILNIYVEPFNLKSHKISPCGDYICAIDGSPFFGTDGKIPTKTLSKLTFLVNNTLINLDVSAMYEPGITNDNLNERISVQHYWGDFYKIIGKFSDGSGSYVSQWLVSKHGAIRTNISDIELLSDFHSIVTQQ